MHLIIKNLHGIKKYVQPDGSLYCCLLTVLYGFFQANKLWVDKLTWVLQKEGYQHNPIDPGVMKSLFGEQTYLLFIYVDDILLFADEEEIKCMDRIFIQEFIWISTV